MAAQARRLGDALITKANKEQHQLRLSSYDRMFPNQDTLPSKGYGNLIALPLQKHALRNGNSAFLDSDMNPYPDQWELLRSVQRMSKSLLDKAVREAVRNNELMPIARPCEDEDAADKVDPWAAPSSSRQKKDTNLIPPLPEKFTITLGNLVYIPKEGLSKSHLNRMTRIAAFQNPKFYENQSLRLSNYKTPRIISCAEEFPDHLALPRGCLDELTDLIEKSGAGYDIDDQRYSGQKIKTKFKGKLRADQTEAVKTMLRTDSGVLSATTAFGKTVVAAYCISKRKVNTLVLVHRAELLEQWKQRLTEFLDLPPKSIGQFGAGKRKPTGIVDVAMIQSVCNKGEVDEMVANYGQIIVDECHHIGAPSFEQVLRQARAKYVLGLTATPVRKDGHHPIVVMQCGPIRHRVLKKDHRTSIKEHLVFPKLTDAVVDGLALQLSTQEIISTLVHDEKRNELIVSDVLGALSEKRTPLVLTERTEHLEILADKLRGRIEHVFVFRGGLGKRQVSQLRKQLELVPAENNALS